MLSTWPKTVRTVFASMLCVRSHRCLPVWLWMLTVPPLQTSKPVFLLRLLRCSSSHFSVDSLRVSLLSPLFDSGCSLCGRSLAATLATSTRSSPRWRWSWRPQTNSSSWTWTRTSSRASPTPTLSLSFRSEEPLPDSGPAPIIHGLIQPPIACSSTVSGFIAI